MVGTALKVLGMIRRTFGNFSKEIIIKLYKCLIRPHLEYAVQAWRPHLRKDMDLLEKVQRRATKLVVGTRGKGYEERLQMLGMTTLETRRIRGDLIEVFKIMKGLDKVEEHHFFDRAVGSTRGHDLKLNKPRCRLNCRKFCFSHRVVDLWNKLPNNAVACNTVVGFKNKVDDFLKCQGFK